MRSLSALVALLALLVGASSCGGEQPVGGDPEVVASPEQPGHRGQVLGVCFMEGEPCVSTYEDLGEYEGTKGASEKKDMVPAYVFPAIPATAGGAPNPWDPNGRYQPYRLQNNVFAGPGRIWSMWEVRSANLVLKAEPQPGVTLWGAGVDPGEYESDDEDEAPGRRVRDLYLNPFTSEEEILTLARLGDVMLVDLRLAVDCPLVRAGPEDEVVNLNPDFPLCDAE